MGIIFVLTVRVRIAIWRGVLRKLKRCIGEVKANTGSVLIAVLDERLFSNIIKDEN